MRPLIVRAHMAGAFVSASPWSPMLDGVLAYEVLRREMGDEFYAQNPQRDGIREAELPLARDTDGADWWWACSVPEYVDVQEHVRWSHGRFDDQHERYIDLGRRTKVETAGGRYKDMRLPLITHLATCITWNVRGCETCIRELLRDVTHLGQKRAAGHGLVREWSIEAAAEDLSWHRWVPAPQGRLQGIRPPYWHHELKRPCVLR